MAGGVTTIHHAAIHRVTEDLLLCEECVGHGNFGGYELVSQSTSSFINNDSSFGGVAGDCKCLVANCLKHYSLVMPWKRTRVDGKGYITHFKWTEMTFVRAEMGIVISDTYETNHSKHCTKYRVVHRVWKMEWWIVSEGTQLEMSNTPDVSLTLPMPTVTKWFSSSTGILLCNRIQMPLAEVCCNQTHSIPTAMDESELHSEKQRNTLLPRTCVNNWNDRLPLPVVLHDMERTQLRQ